MPGILPELLLNTLLIYFLTLTHQKLKKKQPLITQGEPILKNKKDVDDPLDHKIHTKFFDGLWPFLDRWTI